MSSAQAHLVTGGAGFIGSHIAESLVAQGHDVYVVDDLSGGDARNVPAGVVGCYYDDLSDVPKARALASSIKPNVIWHLAANAREGASFYDPVNVDRRNVGAYLPLLEASIKQGLRRVVMFSSMSVYGDHKPPFEESLPHKPQDVYGVSKAAMEINTRVLSECHGFDYVIIRPHNVFGERQALFDPYRNVFGIWMNRVMHGGPIVIYGDGEQRRAFSYIGDALPWMVKLGMEESGEIFNVGGLVDVSLNEAADALAEAWGAPIERRHDKDRHGEVKHAWPDHQKIVSRGYVERAGWKEGLRRMAAWAKERGPQDWRYEPLAIRSERIPNAWREFQDGE